MACAWQSPTPPYFSEVKPSQAKSNSAGLEMTRLGATRESDAKEFQAPLACGEAASRRVYTPALSQRLKSSGRLRCQDVRCEI